MRLFVLGIAAMMLAGCYTYEPVAVAPAPAQGADIRLRITDVATADLRDYLGPNVETLHGRLVRADTQSVGVAVRSVVLHNGSEQFWTGDQISIPRNAVAGMELRRFSKSRTTFLTALSVVGAFVLADALLGGGDAGGEGRPTPIPPGQ